MTVWQAGLKTKAVKIISAGWIGFIAENLVLSHNREEIISRFGESTYHQVYNTLSTMACSTIAFGYFKLGRKSGPTIAARRSLGSLVLGCTFRGLGLAGLFHLFPTFQLPVYFSSSGESKSATAPSAAPSAAPTAVPQEGMKPDQWTFRVRCPMDFKPKDVPADGVHGLERVSRHATLWSFGLACLGTALSTVYVSEIVMFTFPIVFTLIGSEHQDYRFRRGSGGVLSPEMEDRTSNIPFLALITGKQSWSDLSHEVKWTNTGIAAAIAVSLFLKRIR